MYIILRTILGSLERTLQESWQLDPRVADHIHYLIYTLFTISYSIIINRM